MFGGPARTSWDVMAPPFWERKALSRIVTPKFAWCATCREHLYFVTGFGLECGGMKAVRLGVSCVSIRNSIVYFVT